MTNKTEISSSVLPSVRPPSSPAPLMGAAYVRVSTEDQTELSPDAQVRVILEAANAEGYMIPKEYIFVEKKGISGRQAENRPEFQRMIAIAKSQSPSPFSRLYLWKFSRFARNQEESTFYKGILRKKCGVDIKSISEPIMEGMFGRLIETIIEWFDEYYSYNLSGEVLRGMTEKALREGYQSSPCLGYNAAGGGTPFLINETEYAAVQYLFQTYYSGLDMTATARAANHMGYVTKRGNPFDRRAVSRILTNRFYNGIVAWNGIQFQGTHEIRPAVTAIFKQVQKRIGEEQGNRHHRDISSQAHWLSGLLKCGTCGASLGYNKSSDSKKRPDFFQCWKYAKGIHPGSCCLSVHIAELALQESLLRLEETIGSQERDYNFTQPANNAKSVQEEALQEAFARLDLKEHRIREAYENGIDTLEEFRENKKRLQAESQSLTAEISHIHDIQKSSAQNIFPATAHELISNPEVDGQLKGAALRKVIKKIEFDRASGCCRVFYRIL